MYLRSDVRFVTYLNRFSERFDKWLFIISFGIGVALILLLKALEVNQFIVTLAPLTVMVVYAVYVFGTKRYQIRADRAGDNLYFLGFLFTLTSLSHSLYLFLIRKGEVEAILGNFGIALSTTILGLGLRVLFNQMREDPVEIENETRIALAGAASKLKAELFDIVRELNSFRRSLQQSLSEGLEEMAKKSNKLLESQARQFDEVTEETLKGIRGAFADFKESSAELVAQIKPIASAAKKLLRGMESIDIPVDILERKFDLAVVSMAKRVEERIGETIQFFSLALGEVAKESRAYRGKQIEELDQMTAGVLSDIGIVSGALKNNATEFTEHSKRIATDVEAIVTRVNAIKVPVDLFEKKLQPSIDSLLKGVEKAFERMESETVHAEKLEKITSSMTRSSDKLLESVSKVGVAAEKAFALAKEEVDMFRGSLLSFRQSAELLVNGFQRIAEQQNVALKGVGEETSGILSIAKEHRIALAKELESSRLMVDELSRTLISLSKLIIEKVNE